MGLNPKSFLYTVDPATAVATITLNRPERLNALTFEVYTELRDTFRALDTEPGVRAVIITGTRAGLLQRRRRRGHHRRAVLEGRGGAARVHPAHRRSHPLDPAMSPAGRGGAQRNGGRRGRGDRRGQRHPDRGGERQDRLPLLAGRPRRRRHGRGVAAAADRRPGARERAPHAGRLHQRRARRRRSGSTTGWCPASG